MKKILLILLALTITIINLKAEKLQGQAKIDSLLSELPKAKGDTNEVKLLSHISFTFYSINPDKGIEYGKKGLELAKDLKWKKGESRAYNALGANNFLKSNYSEALNFWNKALKINEKQGFKSETSSNLINIGTIYRTRSDYKKTLEYFEKALNINKDLRDNRLIANILGNIGNVYHLQSDYEKALEYFEEALKINEEIGSKSGVAIGYRNIGGIYQRKSDYATALEYYIKALKINEELGLKNNVANQLNRIGSIYKNQSNNKKALEYFEKALKINEELGSKRGMGVQFGSIGSVYILQSDYEKALEYFEKALKINTELGLELNKAGNLGSIGIVYMYQAKYKKALEYYSKSMRLFEKLEDKSGVAFQLGNLGELYLIFAQNSVNAEPNEMNKYTNLNSDINLNKSIEYSLKSIKIFEELGELNERSNNLKVLADAFRLKNDFKKADKYYQEHIRLRDSIYSKKNTDKIAALEKAREDDLKQKEIEKQKLKIAEQEKREQLILYFSIGFFIVMAIVMFIIYRLLKRSDKLLYNVLPVSIAKRLKKKEHPISDYFTQASIVFIDIVNFTEMASDSDPQNLVSNLNTIFTKYDTIANKYGLEKIKTIGDSYMAAAGIPEVQKDNTHRAAQMALEVKEMMRDYRTADGTKIEVRIGLDCGPVVAGVIGENKFIYDMWSDAVNTASRMESSSESGQVHITERFKEAVSEFEQFEYVERGEIEIKGKGMMKTYYIENKEVVNV